MPREKKLSAEYLEYLGSPQWRQKREMALWRAGRRCQVCNAADNLDIHHRTYERFQNERPEDLTVLCRRCHDKFHDLMPAVARKERDRCGETTDRKGGRRRTLDQLPHTVADYSRRSNATAKFAAWLMSQKGWPPRAKSKSDLRRWLRSVLPGSGWGWNRACACLQVLWLAAKKDLDIAG